MTMPTMTVDRLTGIKIGNTVYREGLTYTDTSQLSGLLGGVGGGVSVDDFGAEFDVSKNKLAILISSDVAGMGASASVDLKLVFDGTAKGKGSVAKDFKVKELGAGVYADAGGFADTEVIASVETTKPTGLAKAFKTLGGNPEKLLKRIDLGSLDVYAAGGLAPQLSGLLADQGLGLTSRPTAVAPFAADFMGAWWNAGL